MTRAANKTALVSTLKTLGFNFRPVQIKQMSAETLEQIITLTLQINAMAKPTNAAEREVYNAVYNQRAGLCVQAKPGASFNDLKRAAAQGNPRAINALRGYLNSK